MNRFRKRSPWDSRKRSYVDNLKPSLFLNMVPKQKYFSVSFLFIIALLVALPSCVTYKNRMYLRVEKDSITEYIDADMAAYKLKPKDELYIKIKSLDDEKNNVYTKGNDQLYSNITPYSASLLSYKVDLEGYLDIPYVGEIYVENMTLPTLTTVLEDSLQYILNSPAVSLTLINKFVTLIGEVNDPGHYTYTKDKLNILDALGMADDITDYGKRDEVVVTRNEEGVNKIIVLDLTKRSLLASEKYYLKPNDIVFVPPMRKKFWGLSQFPYGFVASTIATTVLLYGILNN